MREFLGAGGCVCGNPDCKRHGQCHGPGCEKKARTAKRTRPPRYVEGEPTLFCSRTCSNRHRREKEVAEILATTGPCGGTPCVDPGCKVHPGHCHQCPKKVPIAEQTVVRRRYVEGHPIKFCSSKCWREYSSERVRAAVAEILATTPPCGCTPCRVPGCKREHHRCHWGDCPNKARIASDTTLQSRHVAGEPLLYCDRHGLGWWGPGGDAFQAELERRGLVPVAKAAGLLGRSRRTVAKGRLPLEVVRFDFGAGVVRLGINAREVRDLSPNRNVRRVLWKPLAVLNGTTQLSRAKALSDAEASTVVRLRAADPVTWSWRKITAHLNEERASRWLDAGSPTGPAGERPREFCEVSFMTVKREFARATGSEL